MTRLRAQGKPAARRLSSQPRNRSQRLRCGFGLRDMRVADRAGNMRVPCKLLDGWQTHSMLVCVRANRMLQDVRMAAAAIYTRDHSDLCEQIVNLLTAQT